MKLLNTITALPSALLLSVSVGAASYFNDFSSGDLSDFTFEGLETANWTVVADGRLHSDESGTPGTHVPTTSGGPGVALVNGFSDLDYFRIEARISVDGDGGLVNGSGDFGHVGFVWGFTDFSNLSMTYLRTHSNHVTAWSRTNSLFSSGEVITGVNPTTNGVEHDFAIEVDHSSKTMHTWYDGSLIRTINGAQFDIVSPHINGGLGVITWGEDVTYDNLRITARSSNVPDTGATVLLLSLGLACLGFIRRTNR